MYKVCKGDNHPIPRIEDLAYALSSGDKFTKLDLYLHSDSHRTKKQLIIICLEAIGKLVESHMLHI